MTITQLRYILAVAEHQSFTKAADQIFVTQPTLSMQIQKLEEELDILIFNRSKKPVQLTAIGEKLINQARNIVVESERLQDVVDIEKGFIGGVFKLGIIPTVMPTLLPMFLRNFSNKYPKVRLKIEELNTDEIITKINDGYLDAAIAATPLKHTKIKERPLYYEPFVGYIPENHRLSSKMKLEVPDLDIDDILLLEDGHCFRDGIINLCKTSKAAGEDKFQLESGSFETLIKLSNEGLGMTLLPYLHTLDISEKLQKNIKYFSEPSPAREVSLIYSVNELKLQVINALYEVISGVIRGAIAFHNVKIISPVKKK
ncbi:LysR family transcriptional regulator [Aequorivita echinoideorum]|uniref:LysR family transcriptional regulator n=1 Tax=Aequorivita echinoideorum TaxID=1549647 RepID=A0ABS5S936_9FLAO|nr:LysR substrate-binding domain-containing protein [Aequorivita echinoideorum]MBT0608395.1 LysR family transcriptional regulator [Aequorivita echinoideorum]